MKTTIWLNNENHADDDDDDNDDDDDDDVAGKDTVGWWGQDTADIWLAGDLAWLKQRSRLDWRIE